jgi:hypothetical protein
MHELRLDERKQAGLKIWDELSAPNKEILESISKSKNELAPLLADLNSIKAHRQACDPKLVVGMHKIMILDGLPPQTDEPSVAKLISMIDSSYDETEIMQRCTVRGPLFKQGEGQLGPDSYASARLTEFEVTEKLKATLLRQPDTHIPAGLSKCFLRPELRLWDDRSTILPRSPALDEVLTAAHALGMDRRMVEQMLRDGLKTGLQDTSLGEQIMAVDIDPMKWPENKGGGSARRTSPFFAHYTEKEQIIKVFLTTPDNVENLRSLTEAIQMTVGGTSIYVNLLPTRPRSELAEVEEAILGKAIRKAKEQALPNQVIRLVKARVTTKQARVGRLNYGEVAAALVEGLGGTAKGIHGAVPTFERYGAKPERGTTFVVVDYPADSEVPTEFAERLSQVLKASGRHQQGLKGDVFSEIRVLKGTEVEISSITEDMEGAGDELTINDTKTFIEDQIYYKNPLYLPLDTKAGGEVVFVGECTPLAEIIETRGRIISEGDLHMGDIREIFPRPVSTTTFYTALQQMKDMGEVDFVRGDKEDVGFNYIEICHPLKHRLRKGGAARD